MSLDRLPLLGRRAVVLAATAAVIIAAAWTVGVAAEWRAAAAPLGTAPVGMETISRLALSELDRRATVAAGIDQAESQIASLRVALGAADQRVPGDAKSAEALRTDLSAARERLGVMTGQLAAARERLAELDLAASRQAAINAAAARGTTRAASDDDHEDEPEEDDD